MTFWQLTIDANDPPRLAAFWSAALGYRSTPPAEPPSRWADHYRMRLGDEQAFDDRLFDPDGVRPPIWFQPVPETKAGKNRVHVDLHPEGDTAAYLDGLVARGATVLDRHGADGPVEWAVVADPEGNEFCVVLGRSNGHA